ncbi:MAG: hypothetical protein WC458_02135 [Patescibacteria group bacterium]
MKNSYRLILYVFLGLIIFGGLALFIFNDQVLEFLGARSNLTVPAVSVKNNATALDLGPLKDPRFTVLVNNVVDFDFDNICHRPDSAPVVSLSAVAVLETATEATTTEETAPESLDCVQGNNFPFLIKTK